MCQEIPIILASHGPFAQGALDCAEMLIGKQDNIAVITVDVDSNIDQLKDEMAVAYATLNQGRGVLILTDLMGGTPCNLAGQLSVIHSDVLLYCGFNIPVLLEVFANRELPLEQIGSLIEETFAISCINVTNLLNTQHNHSDDLL